LGDPFTASIAAAIGHPATAFAVIVIATFILEDAATIAAGVVVADGMLAPELALAALWFGVAAGDIGLYGLGAAGARSGLLRRWLAPERVEGLRFRLERRLATVLVGARFMPGLRLPTYTAAGALGVCPWRFAGIVVLATLVWTSLLFCAACQLGATTAATLGPWRWGAAVLLLAGVWAGERWLGRRWQPEAAPAPVVPESRLPLSPELPMPPLDTSGRPVSFFEFWPPWLFYAPFALWWTLLAIRYRSATLITAANPSIRAGGLVGESKIELFEQLQQPVRDWVAPWAAVRRSGEGGQTVEADVRCARAAMAARGLEFPVVTKPDMGCRGAGVRVARSEDDLRAYIEAFPAGATFIVQALVDAEGEAGVFWIRHPGQPRGEIFSLTLKYFPYVEGDGRRTLRELIEADPRAGCVAHLYLPRLEGELERVLAPGERRRLTFSGSHCRGAIFRDGEAWITEALRARFAALTEGIPEFWFGRFDVRFESFEAFRQGEDFRIVEINGAGSEATAIWDRNMPLWRAWGILNRQLAHAFAIGAANRRRGFRPCGPRRLLALRRRERELTERYPLTE